jgi:cytochrome d ubiquinol oxidase subunit II
LDLQILWFVLIGILFTGFFVLEGFDFGVGMLIPFLGRNDSERRTLYQSIGPFWDANEVWLIAAAGAMFAAFPNWYATFFSSFYLAMFLILIALILRGTAFEFRSKRTDSRWRKTWDWIMFAGSLLPGFLWGVIIANLIEGMPIDAGMNYIGNGWQLLNPYALLGGLVFSSLFALHGAVFLGLRLSGALLERARRAALRLWTPTFVLITLFIGYGYFVSPVIRRVLFELPIVPLGYLALLLFAFARWFLGRREPGRAFAMTTLTIIFSALILGQGLFPHVMISSLNPAWSLTIENASSSPYTLTVMSWLSLTLIPFVLAYQGWSYWIFRKRLTPQMSDH